MRYVLLFVTATLLVTLPANAGTVTVNWDGTGD